MLADVSMHHVLYLYPGKLMDSWMQCVPTSHFMPVSIWSCAVQLLP